ncbi:MAG: hypothetical protein K2W82_10965 [Candidatus Obscuribacterales bacterium]|nr:hypothetical protein [Candidatus Obscuribacterales bacterium]
MASVAVYVYAAINVYGIYSVYKIMSKIVALTKAGDTAGLAALEAEARAQKKKPVLSAINIAAWVIVIANAFLNAWQPLLALLAIALLQFVVVMAIVLVGNKNARQ